MLYRTEDGKPVALADACWHRLAPLSMGKVIGKDGIRCPYHGIVYNSAGRCVSMPAQEVLNPSATVPSYPVVERHRFIWVWVGDPLKADRDAIPDMHQMLDPAWAGDGETINLRVQLPVGAGQPDGPHPRGVLAHQQHRRRQHQLLRLRGHPRRWRRHPDQVDDRRSPGTLHEGTDAQSSTRVSRAMSIAGRSSTTSSRRPSASTWAWPRPAPARRRATAARASTAT